MNVSDRGLALIRKLERCVLRVYADVGGKETVGVGHLLTDAEKAAGTFAKGITQDEADALLKHDVAWVEAAILRSIHVPLNQNQFDALASFVFNLGPSPLTQGVGRALNDGRYEDVPNEMKRWCKALVHGKVAVLPVLVARRAAEAALFMEFPTLPSTDGTRVS